MLHRGLARPAHACHNSCKRPAPFTRLAWQSIRGHGAAQRRHTSHFQSTPACSISYTRRGNYYQINSPKLQSAQSYQ
eukprot:3593141-Amphidinium_carterae.1